MTSSPIAGSAVATGPLVAQADVRSRREADDVETAAATCVMALRA